MRLNMPSHQWGDLMGLSVLALNVSKNYNVPFVTFVILGGSKGETSKGRMTRLEGLQVEPPQSPG